MNTRIEFKTLDEIKGHTFLGNHAADHQAFQGIRRFVEDETNSLADRAEAIRIECDKGMGMGRTRTSKESDKDLVAGFLSASS